MLLPFAANKQLIFNSGCGQTNSSGSQKSGGRNNDMVVVKLWGGLNQQLMGSGGAVNSLLITEDGDGDACSNQPFTNSTPSPDSVDPFRRPTGGADHTGNKTKATASQE